jgi:hypothetical protein
MPLARPASDRDASRPACRADGGDGEDGPWHSARPARVPGDDSRALRVHAAHPHAASGASVFAAEHAALRSCSSPQPRCTAVPAGAGVRRASSRGVGVVRAAGYRGAGHCRVSVRSRRSRASSWSSAQIAHRPAATATLRRCTQPRRCHVCPVALGLCLVLATSVNQEACGWRTVVSTIVRGRGPGRPR